MKQLGEMEGVQSRWRALQEPGLPGGGVWKGGQNPGHLVFWFKLLLELVLIAKEWLFQLVLIWKCVHIDKLGEMNVHLLPRRIPMRWKVY